MKKEFVRNPYNYDSDEHSNITGLLCKDESLTEQEHAEEADINYIAERFMRTGELPQVLNLPTPGDFEGIFDFQTAMNTIKQAKDEFMTLPAKLRTRFANDPAQLIDFLNDPSNREEAAILGLVPRSQTDGPGDSDRTQAAPQERTRDTGTAAAQGEGKQGKGPRQEAHRQDRGGAEKEG